MRPTPWFRALSGVLVFFTVGHTIGTAVPKPKRGPVEVTLFDAMKSYHFEVMGFTRSHYEFYQGFALSCSALMLTLALLAWCTGTLARTHAQQAMPFALLSLFGSFGLLVSSVTFFFAVPIVTALVSTVLAAVGTWTLARARS